MLEPLKTAVSQTARQVFESGLTWGAGGNVSGYDPESQLAVITATGVPLSEAAPDNLAVVTLAGEHVEGSHSPSSETPMHTMMYAHFGARYQGVVHTHSPAATAVACLGCSIPPLHYLIALVGQEVPLAQYATYGTPEMGQEVLKAIGQNKAVLLEQHGVLALGTDVKDASAVAQAVEYLAELYLRASAVSTPRMVPTAELERLAIKFQSYGQPSS